MIHVNVRGLLVRKVNNEMQLLIQLRKRVGEPEVYELPGGRINEYEKMGLREIVERAPEGPLLNNAGQVLNHTLYFLQFTPNPSQKEPEGKLAEAIRRDFGNFENFKDEMTQAGTTLFGSGWAWLAMNQDGKLVIVKEANGGNPIRQGMKPLLGFDVWEHAYYLDYQNRRTDHLAKLC